MSVAAWFAVIGSWAAMAWVVLSMTRHRRVLDQAVTNVRGLSEWANWTMFTVVERNGDVHAWTLRQLYDWQITDRSWCEPVSVTIWQANGELYKAWQEEAKTYFTQPGGHHDA